jgi:hypothetical protein
MIERVVEYQKARIFPRRALSEDRRKEKKKALILLVATARMVATK